MSAYRVVSVYRGNKEKIIVSKYGAGGDEGLIELDSRLIEDSVIAKILNDAADNGWVLHSVVHRSAGMSSRSEIMLFLAKH